MPLHLLGKKSWNVYNTENIARVRRDEAQAKAREEEQERRMQEIDAGRRIQILRGERPSTPPPPPRSPSSAFRPKSYAEDTGRSRKRRRLAGENDTDRDIRFAREDTQLALAKREELLSSRSSDAPLYDSSGHIDLFPSKAPHKHAEKNPEAEKELTERQKAYEDQYTMRFSNAAGFRHSVGQKPWYSSSGKDAMAPDSMPGKSVWGNEDPMRREREKARMDANDPLAAMKKGVRQLRFVEQERMKWNEGRRKELEALKLEEKHRSHRRRRSQSVDSLEGFKLDTSPGRHQEDKDRTARRHRHHGRDRSRDRSHKRNSHSDRYLHRHDRDRDHHRSDHDRRSHREKIDTKHR
ncbi:hypothetical protein BDV28DRAFT_84190 [Aspergillus coremiiformis]|uniref:CBF1-interacting co-repressor CIR N-terminal domain-containing protein n=1 Tax=Aspergillus coremiiformis TaxID=138285 RepID=A0A5N6YY85_9EURO|nr:hypothetical protein BDV28DRAFT_84190 [Aspergillus coremiiformis]